jgi:hypothetical protein
MPPIWLLSDLYVLADMLATDTQGVAQPTRLLILIRSVCEFLHPKLEFL